MKKVTAHLCRFIATIGPVGYVPYMPGTLGTICAIPLFILMRDFLSPLPYFNERIFIACCLVAAIWVINQALLIMHQQHDPSEIVIDEVVGFFIVLMDEPLTLTNVALAFAYFRFFDILKPFGIRFLENIPGGWGIVLDDVVAAYIAHIFLSLTQAIIS